MGTGTTATPDQVKQWALRANDIRQDIIRMVTAAESGHPGGPLGLADIYTVLFDKYLNFDPKNPRDPNRDRFVLSNGHVCAVAYSVIARAGGFPVDELLTFRKLGSNLHGHPSPMYYPWIENAGGSLGQGLSFGVGSALAGRLDNADWTVYVAMSDGECQEGMTWEAAMSAAHFGLDNLVAFIDRNDIQIDGHTRDVMNVDPLADKFEKFGWAVRTAAGHDLVEIDEAFAWAREVRDQPAMIVFETVLGKGISFMEDQAKWHGVPPTRDQEAEALAELDTYRSSI